MFSLYHKLLQLLQGITKRLCNLIIITVLFFTSLTQIAIKFIAQYIITYLIATMFCHTIHSGTVQIWISSSGKHCLIIMTRNVAAIQQTALLLNALYALLTFCPLLLSCLQQSCEFSVNICHPPIGGFKKRFVGIFTFLSINKLDNDLLNNFNRPCKIAVI